MSYLAWLSQAQSDLSAAKLMSANNFHSQALWLLSQSIEKAHKAILIALGLELNEKVLKALGHDVGEILKMIPLNLRLTLEAEIKQNIVNLTTNGEKSRYPAISQNKLYGPPVIVAPADEIRSSQKELGEAEEILVWCKSRIERALRANEAMKE
jgi:HEPN domain-containing protein